TQTSGMDAQLDWSANTPFFGGRPGSVFANVNFNYLQKYDVVNFVGGPTLHYKDSIGATLGTPPYGAQFKWKSYTNLGYGVGPVAAAISWRHLPGVRNFALVTVPTSAQLRTDSYDQFDLSARWSATD